MSSPVLPALPADGPRAVTDADFPTDGPTEAQLAVMLSWAVQAPSVLNTQPWRFHVAGERVEVFVDRARQLRTVDPEGREAVISCGAALFTLRLAARHYGFATLVEAPGPDDDPDLIAGLRLAGPAQATDEEEALFRAVKRRHTNRDPYAAFAVPRAVLDAARGAARDEGTVLHVVSDSADKQAAAKAKAEADAVPAPTEAELKAARDAKYAARKKRKKG